MKCNKHNYLIIYKNFPEPHCLVKIWVLHSPAGSFLFSLVQPNRPNGLSRNATRDKALNLIMIDSNPDMSSPRRISPLLQIFLNFVSWFPLGDKIVRSSPRL
jgi:hypothetical protein